VWSLIYWLQARGSIAELGVQLVTGTAAYHLYFLLVSMQVYLVFPLLLRLVRATAHRPWRLLGASAALQLVIFWFLHDVVSTWNGRPGWVSGIVRYAEQLLPSYQLYVVAGALAAVHLAAVQRWVLEHVRLVVAAVVVGALLTEGAYLLQVARGAKPSHASAVLQPVMVGWTLVLTTGLLAVGLAYALRRRPSPVATAVREGSRISFGVFLVHPLVIGVLINTWPGALADRLPAPWSIAVLWLLTVAVSVVAAEVGARSPLSLPLTGRRRPRRRQPANASPAPDASPAVNGSPAVNAGPGREAPHD
jgi:peptidoglycan/LPS O-acetylase OafA/YrhL